MFSGVSFSHFILNIYEEIALILNDSDNFDLSTMKGTILQSKGEQYNYNILKRNTAKENENT